MRTASSSTSAPGRPWRARRSPRQRARRASFKRSISGTKTGWAPGSRTTFTYGVAGRPIEAHTTLWTSTHWAEGPQQLYTHALRGKRVVRSTETWMGTLHLGTRTATFTYATPPADPLLLGDQGVE